MAHYTAERRVEFHHTDMAGIVHFSEFFRYMESAEHEMFRHLGSTVHHPDVGGWPRVACSFEFMAPLRFEDVFEVGLTIEKLGNSSMTLSGEIRRDGTVVARGQSTCVHCQPNEEGNFAKATIPEKLRTKLTSLMEST